MHASVSAAVHLHHEHHNIFLVNKTQCHQLCHCGVYTNSWGRNSTISFNIQHYQQVMWSANTTLPMMLTFIKIYL